MTDMTLQQVKDCGEWCCVPGGQYKQYRWLELDVMPSCWHSRPTANSLDYSCESIPIRLALRTDWRKVEENVWTCDDCGRIYAPTRKTCPKCKPEPQPISDAMRGDPDSKTESATHKQMHEVQPEPSYVVIAHPESGRIRKLEHDAVRDFELSDGWEVIADLDDMRYSKRFEWQSLPVYDEDEWLPSGGLKEAIMERLQEYKDVVGHPPTTWSGVLMPPDTPDYIRKDKVEELADSFVSAHPNCGIEIQHFMSWIHEENTVMDEPKTYFGHEPDCEILENCKCPLPLKVKWLSRDEIRKRWGKDEPKVEVSVDVSPEVNSGVITFQSVCEECGHEEDITDDVMKGLVAMRTDSPIDIKFTESKDEQDYGMPPFSFTPLGFNHPASRQWLIEHGCSYMADPNYTHPFWCKIFRDHPNSDRRKVTQRKGVACDPFKMKNTPDKLDEEYYIIAYWDGSQYVRSGRKTDRRKA